MSASAAARLVIRTFPAQLPRAPAATQPSFVHGRWRKPAISARRRADLRKGGALAAVDGLGTTELGAEAATAFATAEDLRIVAGAGRPQREFKRPAGVRKQEARVQEIEAALAKMPDLLAKRPKGPFATERIQRKNNRGDAFLPVSELIAGAKGKKGKKGK
eukprot:TRINITY_DN12920_c0_g1_i1.p2 TRINITY_DN12920_c0_g1~~TRINITY_DN12920_c0_g1_i1.p2  ORF type:complete len:174 (+),score=68.03 TRINITY_DN12920_c0_g1_i1:40-522(+)